MIRHIILLLSLLQIAHADAATGRDYWENCPGPACPARDPESAVGKSEAGNKTYEHMDRKEMRKERESHENAIKEIEKVERKKGKDSWHD